MAHPLGKVFEERDVSPAFHIRTLERTNLLKLGFLRILVESLEEVLLKNEILIPLLVVNFDVCEVGVNTEGKIRR